jgi:hypothetical protein
MTPHHHPQAARALRDIGTQAALDFAGDDWRDRAIEICTRFFRLHAATTSPHIGTLFEEAKNYAQAIGLEDPPSVNSWGAVCLTMSRRGVIRKTGQYANSASVRSHSRANPLWRLV